MTPTPDPLVAIVVLNWNGARDTIECLRSLDRIDYPNYVVIVVDNGSQDDSIQRIEEYGQGESRREPRAGPDDSGLKRFVEYSRAEAESGSRTEAGVVVAGSNGRLIAIYNDANLGFSEGNNVALRYVARALKPTYMLLLNNDTTVDPAFLSKLVHAAELGPEIGIIGPQVRPYDLGSEGNRAEFCGGRIEWLAYPGYLHNRTCPDLITDGGLGQECDWISGTAMMIRSDCLRYGLLDNGYFFGCEDVDFCIRLRKMGYRVAILPDSIIYHKGGKARRKRYPSEVRDILGSALTNLRFIRKNAPIPLIVIPIHSLQLASILVKATAGRFLRRTLNRPADDHRGPNRERLHAARHRK